MSFEGFRTTLSRNGSGRVVLSKYLRENSSTVVSPSPRRQKSKTWSSFPLSIKTKMDGRFGTTGFFDLFDDDDLNMTINNIPGSDDLYAAATAAAASAEEQMAASGEGGSSSRRRKRYYRHTAQQIQELEEFFQACPHPDEKQRRQLSEKLRLESRQIKFWFQNRRTQMKTQCERHENSFLKQENHNLATRNQALKEALKAPKCDTCGGPAMLMESSPEIISLRADNAHLKVELKNMVDTAKYFMGGNQTLSSDSGSSSNPNPNMNGPFIELEVGVGLREGSIDKILVPVDPNLVKNLSFSAFSEVLRLVNTNGIWIKGPDGSERLNYQDYLTLFPPCIGSRPGNFVSEASRQTGVVSLSSFSLVETFMNVDRWREMFPCLISKANTKSVVYGGVNGNCDGAIHVIQAEMHVLSRLVPVRPLQIVRSCRNIAQGVWAVIDVSIDSLLDVPETKPYPGCRKLPSGCILVDMPNGCTQVTWIEHWEYDETMIHPSYRQMIASGMGFGAPRWFAALQRQCQSYSYLAMLPNSDHSTGMPPNGKKSMYALVKRMMSSFCSGISGSSDRPWENVQPGVTIDGDIRLSMRRIEDIPGEPCGVVLTATTSLPLPVSPQVLFDFLRADGTRSEWDILIHGASVEEAIRIPTGPDHGNAISILSVNSDIPTIGSRVILQETWADPSGCVIVYTPADFTAILVVMNGGDSAEVSVLPSGFAILPDGNLNHSAAADGDQQHHAEGCLLTIGFQILVDTKPMRKFSIESIQALKTVIHGTVDKIKIAMECP